MGLYSTERLYPRRNFRECFMQVFKNQYHMPALNCFILRFSTLLLVNRMRKGFYSFEKSNKVVTCIYQLISQEIFKAVHSAGIVAEKYQVVSQTPVLSNKKLTQYLTKQWLLGE